MFLGAILKAVGTGISIFGGLKGAGATEQSAGSIMAAARQSAYAAQAQREAARDTRSAADTNYDIDSLNVSTNRTNTLAGIEIDQAGNQIAFNAASTNLQLSMMDVTARETNAERIRQFAESRTTASRKELRRQKRSFDQFQSRQRAIVGASGVAFEGSVLDVMAESAGQMQLTLQDMHEQANFDRTTSYGDAAIEDFGAGQERIAAQARFGDARNAFDIGNGVVRLGRIAAEQNYNSGLSAASLNRAQGYTAAAGQSLNAAGQSYNTASLYNNASAQYASASNQRLSAIGGIFSGIGAFRRDRYQIQDNGIKA